jgi:hypothetical protein
MDTLENFLRICRAADYFDSKAIRVESQDDNADSADSNAAHQPSKNSSQVATDFRKAATFEKIRRKLQQISAKEKSNEP